MKKRGIALAVFWALVMGSTYLNAQIPRTLSYQGVLSDASGNPRPDGAYSFTFRLYDVSTGGTPIWTEQKSLEVKRGLFSTALGDAMPFGASVKFDKPYWLGIQVVNEPELAPRIALTSVGYSLNSLRADTAKMAMNTVGDGVWSSSGSNIFRLDGNIGIGIANPAGKLHVRDTGATEIVVGDTSRGNTYVRLGTTASHSGFAELQSVSASGSSYGILSLNPRGGKIGIGTSNPAGTLHVGGAGAAEIIIGDTYPGNTYVRLGTTASNSGFAELQSIAASGSSYGTLSLNPLGGNVGIGTTNPTSTLDVVGRTKTQVLEITGGSDLAEPFPTSESENLPLGAVVVIDENNPGHLKLSRKPYDKGVAGIVSGAGGINPGLTLRQEGAMEEGQLVALTGKVYALATTINGPIKPGDRLTTSSIPGHCMKATDSSLCDGAVIGKAMSSLEIGEGLVLVLVNLQ